jgi:N-methylhydantoinase A/oxoprolinase/acetone carboxylase beta subunit
VCSPRQREVVRSWATPLDTEGLDEALALLGAEAAALVGDRDVDVERLVDCRYAGQSHELTVAKVADFHDEHRRRNGFARPEAPIEVVALRARARRPAPVDVDQLPPVDRARIEGPAMVAEPDATIWIPDAWTANPGPLGAWILRRR